MKGKNDRVDLVAPATSVAQELPKQPLDARDQSGHVS